MDLDAIADYWDDPQASHAEFRRFFLNQPVPMHVVEAPGALDHARWLDLKDPTAPRGARPSFGLDVAGERTAWIAVAWTREDGAAQVMLANEGNPLPAHRATEELARIARSWNGRAVAAKAFEAELKAAGVRVTVSSWADFKAGCGALEDRIAAGTVRHGNQAALNDSVLAVKWGTTGSDASRAFQLKDAPEAGPVAAVVRAMHGIAPRPASVPMSALV